MSQLTKTLSQYWSKIQGSLFPWSEEELDPLTEKQQQLVAILELVRIEEFLLWMPLTMSPLLLSIVGPSDMYPFDHA